MALGIPSSEGTPWRQKLKKLTRLDNPDSEVLVEGKAESQKIRSALDDSYKKIMRLHVLGKDDRKMYHNEIVRNMSVLTHPDLLGDTKEMESAFLRDELEAKKTWGRDMFALLELDKAGYIYEHLSEITRQALSYLGYTAANKLLRVKKSGIIGTVQNKLYFRDQVEGAFFEQMRTEIMDLEERAKKQVEDEFLQNGDLEKALEDDIMYTPPTIVAARQPYRSSGVDFVPPQEHAVLTQAKAEQRKYTIAKNGMARLDADIEALEAQDPTDIPLDEDLQAKVDAGEMFILDAHEQSKQRSIETLKTRVSGWEEKRAQAQEKLEDIRKKFASDGVTWAKDDDWEEPLPDRSELPNLTNQNVSGPGVLGPKPLARTRSQDRDSALPPHLEPIINDSTRRHEKDALKAVKSGKFPVTLTDLYVRTLDALLIPSNEVIKKVKAQAERELGLGTTKDYNDLKKKLEELTEPVAQENYFEKSQEKAHVEGLHKMLTSKLEDQIKKKTKGEEIKVKAKAKQQSFALANSNITRLTGQIATLKAELVPLTDDLKMATEEGKIKALDAQVQNKNRQIESLSTQLTQEEVKKTQAELELQDLRQDFADEGVTWASTDNWMETLPVSTVFENTTTLDGIRTNLITKARSAYPVGNAIGDALEADITAATSLDQLQKLAKKWETRATKIEKELNTTKKPNADKAQAFLDELKKVSEPSEDKKALKDKFARYVAVYQELSHRRTSSYAGKSGVGRGNQNDLNVTFAQEAEVLEAAEGILKQLDVSAAAFYKKLGEDPAHNTAVGLYEFVRRTMEYLRVHDFEKPSVRRAHQMHTDARMRFLFEHREFIEQILDNYMPQTKAHAKAKLWFRHNVSAQGSSERELAGESLSDADLMKQADNLFQISLHERPLLYGSSANYQRRLKQGGVKNTLLQNRRAIGAGLRSFAEWGGHAKIGGALGQAVGFTAGAGLRLGTGVAGTLLNVAGKGLIAAPASVLRSFLLNRRNRGLRLMGNLLKPLEMIGGGIAQVGTFTSEQSRKLTADRRRRLRQRLGGAGSAIGRWAPRIGGYPLGWGASQVGEYMAYHDTLGAEADAVDRLRRQQMLGRIGGVGRSMEDVQRSMAMGSMGMEESEVDSVLAEIRKNQNGKGLHSDKIRLNGKEEPKKTESSDDKKTS